MSRHKEGKMELPKQRITRGIGVNLGYKEGKEGGMEKNMGEVDFAMDFSNAVPDVPNQDPGTDFANAEARKAQAIVDAVGRQKDVPLKQTESRRSGG
jgi:hypothetical protein